MKKIFKKISHWLRRRIAKVWLFLNPQLTIIGITGSYGKTITSVVINKVLSKKYKTLQTDLNLDTIYNLPITILKARKKHQKIILEYGVDHKGEMDFHLSLVKPDLAVMTGINPTHSDANLLGSVQNIIREKQKMLSSLSENKTAFLNYNDLQVRQMAANTKAKIVYYGFDKNNCDYWAYDVKVGFNGTSFKLGMKSDDDKKIIEIKTGLIGEHTVEPCLAAIAIGLNQGVPLDDIQQALKDLKPLPGRLSIEDGPLKSILLNDSLRANPASAKAGLQTLVDLGCLGKKVAVLGEMGELGVSAEEEHQSLGSFIASLKIDYFIGIGPLQKLATSQAVKSGMNKDKVFWAKDVFEAAEIIKKVLGKNDLFYLKGSRLRHMERILMVLEGKKVGCSVNSCHFYNECGSCSYLETGL